MDKCVKLYSPEEDQFLKDNITGKSYAELTRLFNERFGMNRTVSSIKTRCIKNLRLITGIGKGGRQKGCTANNASPIGHIIKDQHGRLWIKIKTELVGKKIRYPSVRRKTNYKRLDAYIWEQENPPLKKGEFLYHLDGDAANCDISNLRLVNHNINGRLTIDRMQHMESAEIQNCAIDYEYLKFAIKEVASGTDD